MCKESVKKALTFLLAFALFAGIGVDQVFAKGKDKQPELPKEEEGYYYGYGKADTPEEAEFIAKKELLENALTEELKLSKPRASRISISDDSVRARLPKQNFSKNDKAGKDVSCKIKQDKWASEEKLFRKNLRDSLASSYAVLTSGKSLKDKIESSVFILNQLSLNGVYDLITFDENGSELYSKKVESLCESFVDQIVFTVSVPDGFVNPETKYTVTVKDNKGNVVSGLTVKASWTLAELPISYGDAEAVDEVVSELQSDKAGIVEVAFPEDAAKYNGKAVNLTVSTAFSASKLATTAMRKLDARSAVDANYIYNEDFAEAYKTVLVEAGEFKAGAVDGDKKAGSKEVKHTVTLDAFEMSLTPVTNAQFAAFLFATRSEEYPEFMSNPDYNDAFKPVIGVSYEDATAYAAWLSEQTGDTYRLPTADEWEKAARAGEEVVYPWGNDDPSKKKIANYNKNGKFKGVSPVGSFPDSTNALGLVDMAGNVWEWTSSVDVAEETEESTLRMVKGGSWMDGPTELRISNYKTVDMTEKSNEVGFRLVKESK